MKHLFCHLLDCVARGFRTTPRRPATPLIISPSVLGWKPSIL